MINEGGKSEIQWLVTIILVICAVSIAFVYIMWKPNDNNRLGLFIINTIPSAFVVLISFPIAYIFLISHGIRINSLDEADIQKIADSNYMRFKKEDNRTILQSKSNRNIELSQQGKENRMIKIPEEQQKIIAQVESNKTVKKGLKDVLVVVDVQNDFFEGGNLPILEASSLLVPLNNAIESAEQHGVLIIYTQDWHPEGHKSFKGNGGTWKPHCIQETYGAKLHPDLKMAKFYEVVKFGLDPDKDGYSPFENPIMSKLLSSKDIGAVFVTGIATEYCVLATCISARHEGKVVYVIENLVRSAEPDKIADIWEKFKEYRILRINYIPW
jgi:nicotinamidase/pyrazinamidase